MTPLLFIHIGSHKTGTSSIQAFLAKNAELLKSRGILYPTTGRQSPDRTSHLLLAWSSLAKYHDKLTTTEANTVWIRLHDEIAASKQPIVVISSEFLWSASEKDIRRIFGQTKRYRTRILIYLRNPLDLALSAYKQGIKRGRIIDDYRTYQTSRIGLYNYQDIINKWSDVFGRGHIIVRSYDNARYALYEDLCKVIGIPIEGLTLPTPRNISPSDLHTAIIRSWNRLRHRMPSLPPYPLALATSVIETKLVYKFLTSLSISSRHLRLYEDSDIHWLRNMLPSGSLTYSQLCSLSTTNNDGSDDDILSTTD